MYIQNQQNNCCHSAIIQLFLYNIYKYWSIVNETEYHIHQPVFEDFAARLTDCQKQVSQAGFSNCLPQNNVWCNYLSLPEIPACGAKVLIWYQSHAVKSFKYYVPWNMSRFCAALSCCCCYSQSNNLLIFIMDASLALQNVFPSASEVKLKTMGTKNVTNMV